MRLPLGRLRDLLLRFGFDVTPTPLSGLLKHHSPSVVLDVGANVGQFGQSLRRAGFGGRIVSFEPIPSVYRDLARTAASDTRWDVRNTALGDRDGMASLHLASNTASSSLLAPGQGVREHAAFLEFEGAEEVRLQRLDSIFDEHIRPDETVALKVDTQGYEQAVLTGAEAVLPRIDTVFLELSLVPLYDGEPPAEVVMGWLRERGFAPAYLAPAFSAKGTRRWIQADVLFVREGGGVA